MAGYEASEHGPGGLEWSRSCLTGAHEDCGHLGRIGYSFWDGGRFTLMLCRCGCHSSCWLAGRMFVSRTIWVGLCDCPGTELAEGRFDQHEREHPDLPEAARRFQERQEQRAREWQERRARKRRR